MSVGDNIRQLRKANNMTLEELSKFISITRQTLCRYESGQIQVPSDKVEMLANVFGVSPAVIMGWESSTPANIIPVPTTTTSPMLQSLCDAFDLLNDEGQEKLVDYADDLVSSGKYKKHGADEVGRKEA